MLAAVVTVVLTAITAAHAQEIGGFPLPDATVGSDIHDKPPPEHLLGSLQKPGAIDVPGVSLLLEYTGEAADIAAGGNRKGMDYAGQLHLKADFDLDRIADLSGASFHVTLINRHGRNASKDYLGDTILQAQEIFGGTHGAIVHLVYAYAELARGNGAFDLMAGRLPVTHDFASSPLYCEFLNTLVCGSPRATVGDPAFTIFPNSTWGGRLRLKPRSDVALQAGVFQVRPEFGGKSGFDWSFAGTGAYFPLELDYLPKLGKAGLPGHYKLGVSYDTSNYPDLFRNIAGLPIAISSLSARQHGGRTSYYALADQMLVRTGTGGTSGVVVFGGYVYLDERTARVASIAFAGVHALGLVPKRAHDSVNLLIGSVGASASLVRAQSLDVLLGQPLAGGAVGVESHEHIVEANYDAQIVQGLHLIPDLQFVSRPGATTANQSALVGAVRVDVIF